MLRYSIILKLPEQVQQVPSAHQSFQNHNEQNIKIARLPCFGSGLRLTVQFLALRDASKVGGRGAPRDFAVGTPNSDLVLEGRSLQTACQCAFRVHTCAVALGFEVPGIGRTTGPYSAIAQPVPSEILAAPPLSCHGFVIDACRSIGTLDHSSLEHLEDSRLSFLVAN